jgi:class 3 adenylate cyclase/pimeloyl-ACP methyl ester carboxylesterase
VDVPDVSYARIGDTAIAYQAVGEGPPDLVLLPFLANIYTLWQAPGFAAVARRLATGRRLIVVNPRGVGLSDRPRGFTVESRMDDIRAVLDDLGSERSVLVGLAEGGASCAVFAASHPDRVERLVLFTPWTRGAKDEHEREQALAQIRRERETWGQRAVLEAMAQRLNPQWADDADYLEWFVWHHRLTASPASYADFRRMQLDLDISDVLSAIRVPTLVISKEHTLGFSEDVAQAIPGSVHVVVPGRGMAFHENEFAVEAIETFLEGAPQRQIPDTVLSTVLFTDLVGSTERAAELGDRAWRELLERHHGVVRRELERFRGAELDTAGDGFFASFDGPARAIGCARAVVEHVRSLGLELRAGIHTGECERVGGKLAGLAVNVGARVSAAAGPGEVLVSGTVKDLVAGSGIAFADRGVRELKGIPGEWRIYSVIDA